MDDMPCKFAVYAHRRTQFNHTVPTNTNNDSHKATQPVIYLPHDSFSGGKLSRVGGKLELEELNIQRVIFQVLMAKTTSPPRLNVLLHQYTWLSSSSSALCLSRFQKCSNCVPWHTWETVCVASLLNREMKESKGEQEWDLQRMNRPCSSSRLLHN